MNSARLARLGSASSVVLCRVTAVVAVVVVGSDSIHHDIGGDFLIMKLVARSAKKYTRRRLLKSKQS